jgi:hypothetical protein
MTILQTVQIIGDALTQLDSVLANPNLSSSDPQFQQLFALRKHLDDQQRLLVAAGIDDSTAEFTQATAQLTAADNSLKQVGADITRIASIINIASTIASVADQVISMAK